MASSRFTHPLPPSGRFSHALREAYTWCIGHLKNFGLSCPPFPNGASVVPDIVPRATDPGFALKSYPSFYMSLAAREGLIHELAEMCAPALRVDSHVCGISPEPLSVQLSTSTEAAGSKWAPQAVIVTSGRLGPLLLQTQLSDDCQVYRRLEVGVRIEQTSTEFCLRDSDALDPKLVAQSYGDGVEWRTFCCCRNGEVIRTVADGISSVAGRADGAPTNLSNIGFNVRVLDPLEGMSLWVGLRARMEAARTLVAEPIDDFLRAGEGGESALRVLLGHRLAAAIADGLLVLKTTLGSNSLQGAVLHGPTLEGVAMYPDVSPTTLRLRAHEVWVGGDATGLFRGLTAALVSGYFVGRQAADRVLQGAPQ